jgi:hypothetical protein
MPPPTIDVNLNQMKSTNGQSTTARRIVLQEFKKITCCTDKTHSTTLV